MRILYTAYLLLLVTVLFSCQKEVSYNLPDNPGGTPSTNSTFKGTIQGNVLDESSKPASGVRIQIGNTIIQTDARGLFHINNAILNSSATMVSAEKDGYFKAFRVFSATSGANHVTIKLIKRNLAGRINASAGGAITLANGTKVTLPASGVVKASGSQPYSGDINVYASYIDPTATDIATTVPGSMLAKDKDGKEVILKSFGMLAVELQSAAGEKLQIASGKTATLVMPIPATLIAEAPASIPLWFVNEQTGIWNEEGNAVKNGNNYEGEVKHFTYWNCDLPGPTVSLSATFLTPHGIPMVQAHVVIRIANASASGAAVHGNTDSLGQINGPVPANVPLILQIVDPCNKPIYSQNIGQLTANTNLGVISVSLTSAGNSVVTLKGKLLNCSNAAVTKGYAILYYDNSLRYLSVNNNGEFNTVFTRCQTTPLTCEIQGVDENSQQQGAIVNVTFTSPVTDAGNILACGTSSTEYINYTIDGVQYGITSNASDSLYSNAFNQKIEMRGYSSQNGNSIFVRYSNTGGIGLAPVSDLVLGNMGTQLVNPFNVNLTNYPASVGQFYEGNFTGQFSYGPPPAQTHNISCTFRIRRIF